MPLRLSCASRSLAAAVLFAWPGLAAEAAPTPAAPAASDPMVAYTVTPHDTLIGLNHRLLVTPRVWPEIARLNGLPDPNFIYPGEQLWIPVRLLQSREVPATVLDTYGDVRIDGRPAHAGDTLTVGEALTTGAASSAVLQLADGSRMRLSPHSEGRLDEHRRIRLRATEPVVDDGLLAATLRLVRGTVEVFATKVLRARPLEVTTPTAVIGVRGTTYRVQTGLRAEPGAGVPADASATEVLEGLVHAQSTSEPSQAVDVPAGYGAPLWSGHAPALEALPPAPDLRGLPARLDSPHLHWQPPTPGALRVQLAPDAAFDHLAVDRYLRAGEALDVTGLAGGTWHLRARRLGADGLEGQDAVATIEVQATLATPVPRMPPSGARLRDEPVLLRWDAVPGAEGYRVELSRQADCKAPHPLPTTPATEWRLVPSGDAWGAATGPYCWDVRALQADGQAGPASVEAHFEIRPTPPAPRGGVSPDGTSIELQWGVADGAHAQVELARDPRFEQVVERADVDGGGTRLPRPAPGTYWARYRHVEAGGFVGAWSPAQRVPVDSSWHRRLGALLWGPRR